MRIERISSVGDAGRWLLDQFGHVLLGLVATPGAWLLGLGSAGAVYGAFLVLATREVIQYRDKDRSFELVMPFWLRHIDRTLDVALGCAGVAAITVPLL